MSLSVPVTLPLLLCEGCAASAGRSIQPVLRQHLSHRHRRQAGEHVTADHGEFVEHCSRCRILALSARSRHRQSLLAVPP